jgi:hypothetical protein
MEPRLSLLALDLASMALQVQNQSANHQGFTDFVLDWTPAFLGHLYILTHHLYCLPSTYFPWVFTDPPVGSTVRFTRGKTNSKVTPGPADNG